MSSLNWAQNANYKVPFEFLKYMLNKYAYIINKHKKYFKTFCKSTLTFLFYYKKKMSQTNLDFNQNKGIYHFIVYNLQTIPHTKRKLICICAKHIKHVDSRYFLNYLLKSKYICTWTEYIYLLTFTKYIICCYSRELCKHNSNYINII